MKARLAKIKYWFKRPDPRAAQALFESEGLGFPTLPRELAAKLKQRGKWLYSTRKIEVSPYFLQNYAEEFETEQVNDYVILSHDGHGVNSWAIQYYLVKSGLCLLLHLRWGGVYTDNDKGAEEIAACFTVADKIVAEAGGSGVDLNEKPLLIVASDFYGSYWMIDGVRQNEWDARESNSLEALNEVLELLVSGD
ncbi:hypothetical protein [Solemya elarraichensis gill symbiont]|uniref:Uncharacterized protein n=1 Tax=Solemya elarraichensis gill symbiont TaxID=1918949 RepID=A0A1T2L6B7_9GAMM|nr:hypothetical protein [Solemya elarraichensis gill symbiont]OOZ40631.1 hypothetical protein BOW52_05630 [Solemya elarraichensis gill symbiont]